MCTKRHHSGNKRAPLEFGSCLRRRWARQTRNDNGAGSGRVAPIPTPPHLLKIILIPVPFKKLNRAGRVWEIPKPAPPRLAPFNFLNGTGMRIIFYKRGGVGMGATRPVAIPSQMVKNKVE